ncbi:MAG: cation:proton antiporter [Nanoarchaeota archaeon]|nr:cation:proton antiporter [Nanoarchaeota archaeon]
MGLGYLANLSWLSVFLLLGVLASIVAVKFKLPKILFLILIGVILGMTNWIAFDESFLISFGLFALVMIIFESTSKFKLGEVNNLYPVALKLTVIFLVINLIFFTTFIHLFFGKVLTLSAILISLLFATMMSGTDAGVVLSVFKDNSVKVAKILEFESIINTPITVIFPLIILYWFEGTLHAGDIILFFTRGVMAGIGTGLVIGLVSFRLMKKEYLKSISPLLLVALALISYTLAEQIGGNGVLSVTTLGLVFGWSVVRSKQHIQEFVNLFTNFLTIVVFILLGLLIKLPSNYIFLLKSIALFAIYIALRFIAIHFTFIRHDEISFKEKIFMSLNAGKGVAVAVIAFIIIAKLASPGMLNSADVANLRLVLELSFLFILYSIILSTAVLRFSNYFIGRNPHPE